MSDFQENITKILKIIGEDPNRQGLLKTPLRVEKSFEYICGGYKLDPTSVLNDALFDSDYDEMVVVKGTKIYSMCEHHLLPFFGECSLAYLPDKKVVGLSKIPRMIDIFARRLQLQEKLTQEIADAFMQTVKPKGVAVLIKARHLCIEMRGAKEQNSFTTTSALRGAFLRPKTRAEFFNIINSPR